MAATTYASFVSDLGDMTVSGVTTKLDQPPQSLNTADLPAMWVQLPRAEEFPLTFGATGGWPNVLQAQLMVAINPTAQGTQAENWSATLSMMDAVATALRAQTPNGVCQGPLSFTLSVGIATVAETDYWAVIADVRGSG